jgi:hypothetical protein
MKIALKGLVLGVFAISFAGVSLADQPKSAATTDPKDGKSINIVVTLPDGQTNYRCRYQWLVTMQHGGQATDSCQVDVPAGSKDAVVCRMKYEDRVDAVTLLQASYKPLN